MRNSDRLADNRATASAALQAAPQQAAGAGIGRRIDIAMGQCNRMIPIPAIDERNLVPAVLGDQKAHP